MRKLRFVIPLGLLAAWNRQADEAATDTLVFYGLGITI